MNGAEWENTICLFKLQAQAIDTYKTSIWRRADTSLGGRMFYVCQFNTNMNLTKVTATNSGPLVQRQGIQATN